MDFVVTQIKSDVDKDFNSESKIHRYAASWLWNNAQADKMAEIVSFYRFCHQYVYI